MGLGVLGLKKKPFSEKTHLSITGTNEQITHKPCATTTSLEDVRMFVLCTLTNGSMAVCEFTNYYCLYSLLIMLSL